MISGLCRRIAEFYRSRDRAKVQARESSARVEARITEATAANQEASRASVSQSADRIDAAGESRSQAAILNGVLRGVLEQANYRHAR